MTDYPIDWTDDTVRRYLTAEAHQKSKEEFEKTHIDIDKLRAEWLFPHPTNDEFVTQEEFRDAILKSDIEDDNRIFILRGETGSGKSQLCQWLEYQIGQNPGEGDDDTHIALHVSRSETRIKDIVDILTEPIEMEIDVRDVGGLVPEKVANAMLANLDAYEPMLEAVSEEEIQSLIADRSGTDLRGILEENIQAYIDAVQSDEEEDIPDLLTEADYRELSMNAFNRGKGGDTIFPALQSFIDEELSTKLGVGDFQQRLRDISEEYVEQGLRPVLICEDLTTFSVLKEQLLDHIFQLDSGQYDVVLGWTTGWEKENIDTALGASEDAQTYMKDRSEGYLSTTDETGQAYFLTDDVTVELTRKYLSVIRDESDVDPGMEIPEADFDGLYPFNAEFVKRAYRNLVQDGNERRTPRLLLMRIVRECLTSTVPPFEAISGNPYVKQFPTPIDLRYPSAVQSIAKWYGIPTAQGDLRVPKSVFRLFDVSIPDGTLDVTDTDVVFQGSGDTPNPTLTLRQLDGHIEPGAELTVQALLNDRPEPDVEIGVDGGHVGYTDDNGKVTFTLPNEEREVELRAEKNDLTDSLTLAVGTDSLTLVATPNRPKEGETVQLTARFNGEPTPGVAIERDGDVVGETDEGGSLGISADNPPSMTFTASHGDVDDELTVDITGARTFPVEVDYSPEDVEQYRFEYQQWVANGDKYDSSKMLKNGAAALLDEWYDPTRLANPNGPSTGMDGIYYTRGTQTPVSLQGVDERQGISIDLPFGAEHDSVYEPLFWHGVSQDGELPHENRYELSYDHLRNWGDDAVAGFKQTMREDIEACLPDGWTVEEFIVLSQYLLANAGRGELDLTRDLVFEDFQTPDAYDQPITKRFNPTDPYGEAYKQLTKSSSIPRRLAEGFFKLKSNFVDADRLNEAYGAVSDNLSTYIEEAMVIDAGDLPDAYKVGTTRTRASEKLAPLLRRIQQYAQELAGLGPSDVDHITEAVTKIDDWYDDSHSVVDLRELYDGLLDIVGDLDVNILDRWEQQQTLLEEDSERLDLKRFGNDIEKFRDLEAQDGPELVALMHEFERSKEEADEWKLYAAIGEMIEAAGDVEVPETDQELENAVRDSEEFRNLVEAGDAAQGAIGGDHV
ncbi:S-layer protein [Natronomonas sp. CBA1123]|uniref:S-layer protein n=1 Tax=Natronomonas sp. CBA1123 TaxID=2668070 RepID=UPI0012EA432F|nr:S-layer protein [Natronomonas sp. CBA1123]MUV85322.1 S-layer protein [Natronomonas sp. CBA1123]